MGWFTSKKTKEFNGMHKRFSYSMDFGMLQYLAMLAREVVRNAYHSPQMKAALEKFQEEARKAAASIANKAVKVAIQALVNKVTKAAHQAESTRWIHDPMRGPIPHPASPFATTFLEVDSSSENLLRKANEHLNPTRNADNEHMFRRKRWWNKKSNHNYYKSSRQYRNRDPETDYDPGE